MKVPSYIEINFNKSLDDMIGEVWKEVVDYEGVYEISSYGRIKRLAISIPTRNKWGNITIHTKSRIHKYHLSTNGRPRVQLSKQGVNTIFTLSRLVAIAFIPNPKMLPEVCHKDDNPLNNYYKNLFWGTQKDNMEDKCKKDRQAKGINHGMALLNEKQVIEIRNKFNGDNHNALAAEYCTCRQNIRLIVNKVNWKHI